MKILLFLLFLSSVVGASKDSEAPFYLSACLDQFCTYADPNPAQPDQQNSSHSRMRSESERMKNQIHKNEQLINSYLPRQVEERLRIEQESVNMIQQLTQTAKRFDEESKALLKALESQSHSAGRHQIYTSTYYVLTPENIHNLQSNYSKFMKEKNYYSAVEVADRLFHSNSNIESLPGFNNDGVFIPEQMDSSLEKSPGSSIQLKSSKQTPEGRYIRRILNDYQIYWGMNSSYLTTETQTYYNVGLAYLKLSDQYAYLDPDRSRGYSYLSSEIIDFLNGVHGGVQNQLKVYRKLIPHVFKEAVDFVFNAKYYPDKAADSLVRLIQKTPELASSFYKGLIDNYNIIKSGTSTERGELVGSVLTDTTLGVLTGGSLLSSLPAKSVAQNLSKNIGQKLVTELTEDSIKLATILEKTPKPLSNKVVDGFVALKNSGNTILQTQSEDILQKFTATQGRAQDFLYRTITSQGDPRTRATYLNSVEDIDKIVKTYNSIETKTPSLRPQTVEGYIARVANKNVTDFEGVVHVNTPESIMKPHPGMVRASNRYGIGGPNGQPTMSYGFGKTPEEALEAAWTERKSYFADIPDSVQSVQPFQSDRVLVLDGENLKKLSMQSEDLITKRDNRDSYLKTNILADNLKDNSNFEYILAPSSPGQSGSTMNLHKVGK